MDSRVTQLEHVFYELNMLRYTFDKLILVEQTVAANAPQSIQAGLVYALIETFSIHARNLDEFFQGSRRADTLKAKTFADGKYKPLPRDKERKDLIAKINKQIAHLTEQRTSVAAEKIGPADRARLHSILIAEADNFTRHLLPKLRLDWEYVPTEPPLRVN
ncbi:MAG: hypothetical protein ACLQF1_06375 [Methyloceanibacter sp.]|jgi:hypothetical protein